MYVYTYARVVHNVVHNVVYKVVYKIVYKVVSSKFQKKATATKKKNPSFTAEVFIQRYVLSDFWY